MKTQPLVSRSAVVVMLVCCCMLGLSMQSLSGEKTAGPTGKAKVYVHPHKLTAKDKLSFGPDKTQKVTIPIKGETTLVFVDLAPEARFAHATQCILISTHGAQVIDGDWWMVLNGEELFHEGKTTKVDFPVQLKDRE